MRLYLVALLSSASCLAQSLPEAFTRNGPVRSTSITIPNLRADATYSFLYSTRSLEPDSRVTLRLLSNGVTLCEKTLHTGDPDLYTPFRLTDGGPVVLRIAAEQSAGAQYTLRIYQWPVSAALKQIPNHRWQDASPMNLGETVFASGDESEYIPLPGTPRKATVEATGGLDWYRFEFDSPRPKLVFFQLDLMERDNLPVDVSVLRLVNGTPQDFHEGEDPVSGPHEVQALPGNKFTPRVLTERGTYYVRVRANHPEYKLRTYIYDAPPYSDPRQAVRTAIDYILAAGDSWHANTPRRGGILDRVSNVHQETSLCVGCHPTHFSQRAALYAARNGYPIHQRQELQFLAERFYNNPRPFYGFEETGAVWARMISAAANVLSRMAHLLDVYESEVTLEQRPQYQRGVSEYLKLYYADRTKLPPDESNGNTPLVSAHEVAWYSWKVTKDSRFPEMIAAGDVKNMIDLCYQTQALVDIDRNKYASQIERNIERILSLQRPDGQWSMRFETNQPEVEFQTGHALWTLASAGVPATNPQVAKAIGYLLGRQQAFGGWMDPLQSFENFRTPFRETQMAILALSSYFPESGRAKGWNATQPGTLSKEPVRLLEQLDQVWDRVPAALLKQIEDAADSNDVLLRQAAVEALGRVALPETAPLLVKHLGDESKLVQRTAAWGLRQIYSRHEQTDASYLLSALSSPDDRTRWGATRVFAQHFAALARRPEMLDALLKRIDDPALTVRMQAIKGLWQGWFWSPDTEVKGRIEDALLAAMDRPQHAWIAQNLREGIYNLADENIRYLYNNWVPLLAREADRKQAIEGRLRVESRLADKFATVLEHGSDRQKKELLLALNEYPLRRGDTYDLNADIFKPGPPVYNRIGNDIEQIVFFGQSADRISRALLPLLDSPDITMRQLAERAALLARPVKFAQVNALAGEPGRETNLLAKRIDTMLEAAEVARAFHPPAPKAATATDVPLAAPRKALDEAYFRDYVEPILRKKGKDGYACVQCHATHTIFNATWSTVMNVVDTRKPENSLLLRKPISSSETEGIAGSKLTAHGGGVRWTKDSPEYRTILEWIEGASN